MADISDVEQALVDAVYATLYPSGASDTSLVGSICRVYRGWPNPASLNADLNSGIVNVTVGADKTAGRTTTRYLPQWQTVEGQPGVAATAAGQTLTITGNPSAGDVVGTLVDGVPFAYRIVPGDSVDLVASNLGQLIRSKRIATVQGSTVTIPGAASVIVRAVCDGSASSEIRRQEKDLRIICWCATPLVRDQVAAAIDAAISQSGFISLIDATRARVTYHDTASFDQAQNALLYRRDLIYTVEYPTILSDDQPSMVFGASDLNSNVTYG